MGHDIYLHLTFQNIYVVGTMVCLSNVILCIDVFFSFGTFNIRLRQKCPSSFEKIH